MDEWKKSFVEKISRVQSLWAEKFDQALDNAVVPVFDELAEFLQANGVTATIPLREHGRRSLKFEVAEDAYALLVFQSTGVGEFQLRRELWILGCEPNVRKSTERLTSLSAAWARKEIQTALSAFVELLNNAGSPAEAAFVAA